MKKILVVGENLFLRLYSKGFEYYSQKCDVQIDFMEVGPLKTSNLIKKIAFKKGYTKQKYYDGLRKDLIAKVDEYDQFLFVNLFYDKEYFVNGQVLEALAKKDLRLYFVDTIKKLPERFAYFDKLKTISSFELQDVAFMKENYDLDINFVPMGSSYCAFDLRPETKPIYDVFFAGNETTKRIEYLDYIAEFCEQNNYKLQVVGHFWHDSNLFQKIFAKNKFKRKHPVLAKYIQNTFLMPEELAKYYEKSRICLNINVEHHIGINQRLYDVMLCKRLILTDWLDTGGNKLTAGKDFAMCDGKEDMVKQIEHYLADDKAYWQVVEKGYSLVTEEYTIEKTLNVILN